MTVKNIPKSEQNKKTHQCAAGKYIFKISKLYFTAFLYFVGFAEDDLLLVISIFHTLFVQFQIISKKKSGNSLDTTDIISDNF